MNSLKETQNKSYTNIDKIRKEVDQANANRPGLSERWHEKGPHDLVALLREKAPWNDASLRELPEDADSTITSC